MKTSTENIKKILDNENIVLNLEKLKNNNPDGTHSNYETTYSEVYEGYLLIRDSLRESIDNGILDHLPFNFRNSIHSVLKNLQTHSSHPQHSIAQFNSAIYQIQLSGILTQNASELDFKKLASEITSLRRKYKRIINELNNVEDQSVKIKSLTGEADMNVYQIKQALRQATQSISELEDLEKEIDKKKATILENEQEIENRRKEVVAFAKNIEKTETSINKIQNELETSIKEDITNKTSDADDLINKAEKALELRETEGIAAAYSSRLKKLNKNKTKGNWLAGALVFVLAIIGLGIWFLFEDKSNMTIPFLLGRLFLTGILVSAAVFCSQQFVSLRNLEEDYEYKVVLSKSILAFANKIEKYDGQHPKLSEYLNLVLSELHQDPLRSRKESKKGKKGAKLDLDTFQKMAETIHNIRS